MLCQRFPARRKALEFIRCLHQLFEALIPPSQGNPFRLKDTTAHNRSHPSSNAHGVNESLAPHYHAFQMAFQSGSCSSSWHTNTAILTNLITDLLNAPSGSQRYLLSCSVMPSLLLHDRSTQRHVNSGVQFVWPLVLEVRTSERLSSSSPRSSRRADAGPGGPETKIARPSKLNFQQRFFFPFLFSTSHSTPPYSTHNNSRDRALAHPFIPCCISHLKSYACRQ
ncbi:hypothetical protein BKA64DRAFT_662627 [Cadophora sp. MPI-SDFR-AT-0126]|nr:hypothetical protein BKA64DRAFT_662627 [Leotiomycetes sp. MPI-SDFR-AT-0126]